MGAQGEETPRKIENKHIKGREIAHFSKFADPLLDSVGFLLHRGGDFAGVLEYVKSAFSVSNRRMDCTFNVSVKRCVQTREEVKKPLAGVRAESEATSTLLTPDEGKDCRFN